MAEYPSITQPAASVGTMQSNTPVSAYRINDALLESTQRSGHNPNYNPVGTYMAGKQAQEDRQAKQQQSEQESQAYTGNQQAMSAYHSAQTEKIMREMEEEYKKVVREKFGGEAQAFINMYDRYKEDASKSGDKNPDAYAQQKITPYWQHYYESKAAEAEGLKVGLSDKFDYNQTKWWLDSLKPSKVEGKQQTKTESKATSAKLSINDVSQEDAALLQEAIANGQLNADHVNSRTAPIYAKMLKSNKKLDLTSSAANAQALKKVEGQRSMVESFEKTASKNFDMIENMYDKIGGDKSVYVLNKLKTKWDYDFSGDPKLVPLARSMKTALTEYAKVITGQTGGAAVSDSARKEVETLLSVADRPETFKNTLKAHRQEMKNRMESFQETIDNLKTGRGGNVRSKEKTQEKPATGQKSAIDQLKEHALAGDAKAQSYLKQKGIAWQ